MIVRANVLIPLDIHSLIVLFEPRQVDDARQKAILSALEAL